MQAMPYLRYFQLGTASATHVSLEYSLHVLHFISTHIAKMFPEIAALFRYCQKASH